jgi:hypothetical protein
MAGDGRSPLIGFGAVTAPSARKRSEDSPPRSPPTVMTNIPAAVPVASSTVAGIRLSYDDDRNVTEDSQAGWAFARSGAKAGPRKHAVFSILLAVPAALEGVWQRLRPTQQQWIGNGPSKRNGPLDTTAQAWLRWLRGPASSRWTTFGRTLAPQSAGRSDTGPRRKRTSGAQEALQSFGHPREAPPSHPRRLAFLGSLCETFISAQPATD